MLRATVTAEDATTDHDAHLGGEGLSLLHTMGGQNDGALLVSL